MKKVLYTVAALAGTMLAAPAAFAQAAAPAAGGALTGADNQSPKSPLIAGFLAARPCRSHRGAHGAG